MKLKKSLGQNFFANPRLAAKIVETVTSSSPKHILEIGPGDGYFTSLFTEKADKVSVIEKDTELAQMLKIKLPQIEIFNQDVLEFDTAKLATVSDETVCFGSLPYNISKKIIAKFLEETNLHEYYFIIQKEVAQKYVQTEKETSIISIATKLYADCEIIMDIKPGAFIPAPKVTSSFVKFGKNDNLSSVKDPGLFIRLVKSAFSSPRKMLRNNLKTWQGIPEKYLEMRPADLSFNDYLLIANSL
jgi:16S rRNA (adenine1518-N6/adenine1519-N6)-dimethyltransferase